MNRKNVTAIATTAAVCILTVIPGSFAQNVRTVVIPLGGDDPTGNAVEADVVVQVMPGLGILLRKVHGTPVALSSSL